MIAQARVHWPAYLAEAWGLGLFMLSASVFGVLLFHPASALVSLVPSDLARRALMGLAMGATVLVNVHSPWGRRSGCHLNPAMTLTFTQLGKVTWQDAWWYFAAQFAGGVLGAAGSAMLLRMWIGHPAVNHVVTVPASGSHATAFVAELALSMALMVLVLSCASRPAWAGFSGLAVAAFIGIAITFESPVSGMSLNPARTLGSAIPAGVWDGLWIYFVAPPLGMLLGAATFVQWHGPTRFCAKLDHDMRVRCIFCGQGGMPVPGNPVSPHGISPAQPELETR